MNLFWTCFGSVMARESYDMHKPVRTATSSTLYPTNFFIQIARYSRSSLDGRGIFDSGRSLQVEFILLNISHSTFGIVANALTLLLDNLSRNSCMCIFSSSLAS